MQVTWTLSTFTLVTDPVSPVTVQICAGAVGCLRTVTR